MCNTKTTENSNAPARHCSNRLHRENATVNVSPSCINLLLKKLRCQLCNCLVWNEIEPQRHGLSHLTPRTDFTA